MSDLLSMSFDSAASPSIRLRAWEVADDGGHGQTGWGFGWYPSGESGAVVVKDPTPTGDTALSRVLRDWERFRATVFLCHIRGAAKRVSQEDTHPFSRSCAGRDWLLAHNGQLDMRRVRELSLGKQPIFEPVGRTDSEYVFCWLLTQIQALGHRRLSDVGWPFLHAWFKELNAMGSLNLLLTDGHDLVAYRDKQSFSSLSVLRRKPPHEQQILKNAVAQLDVGDPLDINRTMVLVATTPLCPAEGWQALPAGEMIVARRGAITYKSAPLGQPPSTDPTRGTAVTPSWAQAAIAQAAGGSEALATPQPPKDKHGKATARGSESDAATVTRDRGPTSTQLPVHPRASKNALERVLSVVHETTYRYETAVERSAHLFRLHPVVDSAQELLDFSLQVTPEAEAYSFDDVFGNQTISMTLKRPYTELKIRAQARVRVKRGVTPTPPTRRTSIPLVWMPWQRQMMLSYLLPPELPETQLRELSDFAMSFVERQDYDLMETLTDINNTLRHDFAYLAKSTNLETTPFDVYVNRRGVCQDFANLFICLARLLGVPARYRVGYIYTGADYDNTIQSEASHAWVELYLPWAGWRGYDPTNGCLADLDHLRVAVGRNYRDATPTSGTIYKGGKGETLTVQVRVEAEDEQH